ncbi:MAG TPA: thymidylate kinase [Terriglobales bacterium]
MPPILISFSGIDGAGKTTQIQLLKEHLAAAGISVGELTFWDNVVVLRGLRSGFSQRVLQSDGEIGTPERPSQRRDKNVQSLPLLLFRCILHIADTISLRRVIRKATSRPCGVVIFDRYIYDQLAALPLHAPWARGFARWLLKLAPRLDLSYVLDAVPEEARARKPEYPLEFMRQYRESYLVLRDLAGLEVIPAGSPEDVHAAVVGRLQQYTMQATGAAEVSSAVIA